ncbi:response regulator [Thalassotalea euphylliae]|uniref:Response regulator n=1 Tax=Thalassotalea euphylliae TaxID=1655234 RepID=A0A3E0TMB8_9GAMM|nr:response regulator [Thalassotalea euphylliae]REL25420.1 response regulator [Thalassotalea euphylliae]
MKLLLLEDDIAFAGVLARQLSRKGYQVEHIDQLDALLPSCQSWQPDAVVLDMNLGTDSSLPLIQRVRAVLPSSKIVLVTGYASIATTVTAIKSGADDYLPKPIELSSLLAVLGDNQQTKSDAETDHSAQQVKTLTSPERIEWEYIQRVLQENQGNVSATARQLNMHRRTLQRKLAKKPVNS